MSQVVRGMRKRGVATDAAGWSPVARLGVVREAPNGVGREARVTKFLGAANSPWGTQSDAWACRSHAPTTRDRRSHDVVGEAMGESGRCPGGIGTAAPGRPGRRGDPLIRVASRGRSGFD